MQQHQYRGGEGSPKNYTAKVNAGGGKTTKGQTIPDPDLLATEGHRVVLDEEHLTYALPFDCRLHKRVPSRIAALLRAHDEGIQPVHLPADGTKRLESAPAALLPLQVMDEIYIFESSQVQEAIGPMMQGRDTDTMHRMVSQVVGTLRLQQALLCTVIDTLMSRLLHAQEKAAG